MPACPNCLTMLTRPGAPHRDITGTPCPGLPERPVCGRCGTPVALNDANRATTHYTGDTICFGSNRLVTTAELFTTRGDDDPDDLEEAAA